MNRPYNHSFEDEWIAYVYCTWMSQELSKFVKDVRIVMKHESGIENEIGTVNGPILYDEATAEGIRLVNAWLAERRHGSRMRTEGETISSPKSC